MDTATQEPDIVTRQVSPGDVPRSLRPIARSASRHGWRMRRQLAPLASMAAVWVAGCVLDWTGTTWWMALAAGAAATVAATVTAVWRLSRRAKHVYTAVVFTAAALWLTAAARWGLDRPMPALLAGGGGILAMPWWWHYRLRGGATDPEPLPASLDTDPRIIDWETRIACPNGPLPQSRLVDIEEIRGGWTAVIELARGNTERAVMATKDIGAALKLRAGSIVIEPTAEGDLHLARILVLPENPLAQRLDWTAPTLDVASGVSRLGWYADMEPVTYRHYRPDSGPVHTLIAGSTDSGKSRTVEQLLIEERHSGVIVSHLIDGKGGISLPDWAESVDEYATTIDEARDLLTKDRNRMYLRIEVLKTCKWTDALGRVRKGLSQFTPGDPRHGLPMLSITIDEAQKILADGVCRSLVEEMIGMSRSCGIKFRLITQVPLLSSLGNSSVIRDAVAAGNVIVLRTANRLSGQVAFNGALPVDPCSLPKQWPDGSTTSGLGFVFAPGADRASTMRVGYVEDPFGWAISGLPAEIEPYEGPAVQGGDGASQNAPEASVPQGDTEDQGIGERAVLAYLAGQNGTVQRGVMIGAIQQEVTPAPALRTLTLAITSLLEADPPLIEREGRGQYRITDAGRAEHERRTVAA